MAHYGPTKNMARDYIARDPKTGKPIKFEQRRQRVKSKAKLRDGPWMGMLMHDIIPLASGEKESVVLRWNNGAVTLRRADGIRALARMIGREIETVHNLLETSLIDSDAEIRIASLEAFPLVAEQRSGALFEVLEVLLDDPDLKVRQAASKCLGDVAPTFPSVTYEMLERELRHSNKSRKEHAWRGLRDLCSVWPEVVAEHLDVIFQEPVIEMRRRGAKLLRRILERGGAAVWDLVSWTLQDEDVEVRRSSAGTLRKLAEHYPKIALIIAEDALFDPDEVVRERVIKCLNLLDSSSTKFRSLVLAGVRHRDIDVRLACVHMMPRLFSEREARDLAQELLRQEVDKKMIESLEEIIFESELEGDERQKNAGLAPAVAVPERDREIMASQGDNPFDRQQKMDAVNEERMSLDQFAATQDQAEKGGRQRQPTRQELAQEELEMDLEIEAEMELKMQRELGVVPPNRDTRKTDKRFRQERLFEE